MGEIKVLVVDDEKIIVNLYTKIFSNRKKENSNELNSLDSKLFEDESQQELNEPVYSLISCHQGADAVEAAKKAASDNNSFHIAFVDFRMPPGINGLETAKQIRKCSPGTHIVIITGYTDIEYDDLSAQVPPGEKIAIVQKPFRSKEIKSMALSSFESSLKS